MTHHWKLTRNGYTHPRPIACQSEDDARRRALAALGWHLEYIDEPTSDRMEAASVSRGGLPAISEACEPNEECEGAPCDGLDSCPLRHRCPKWLANEVARTGTRYMVPGGTCDSVTTILGRLSPIARDE